MAVSNLRQALHVCLGLLAFSFFACDQATADPNPGKLEFKFKLKDLDGYSSALDGNAEPTPYAKHLAAAEEYRKAKSWQEAIAECEAALAIQETAGAFAMRGITHADLQDYHAAIDDFQEAKLRSLGSSRTRLSLMIALMHAKRFDYGMALDEIDEVLLSDPSTIARVMKARVLSKAGRHDEAITEVRSALSFDPDNTRLWKYAMSLCKLPEHSNSLLALTTGACEQFPDNADILCCHFKALAKIDNFEGLLAATVPAVERFPEHAGISFYHAFALNKLRRLPRVQSLLVPATERCCELHNRSNVKALLLLVMAYAQAEEWELALSTCEEAMPVVNDKERLQIEGAMKTVRDAIKQRSSIDPDGEDSESPDVAPPGE